MSNHLQSWKNLQAHAAANFPKDKQPTAHHLRALLQDEARCNAMRIAFEGTVLDYSRSKATRETTSLWFDLARETKVADKIQAMARGDICNITEQRAVLHAALRCSRDSKRFAPEIVKQVSCLVFVSSSSSNPTRSGKS